MRYEEVVEKVQSVYENADARDIFEHIAVQINSVGEGSGAFYLEVAQRKICVEPYDYHDRDGLITASAKTLCDIADQKIAFLDAYGQGLLKYEGNMDKFHILAKIRLPEKKKGTKAKKV